MQSRSLSPENFFQNNAHLLLLLQIAQKEIRKQKLKSSGKCQQSATNRHAFPNDERRLRASRRKPERPC